MSNKKLTKVEILNMVENNQITAEEAFRLINEKGKKAHSDNTSTIKTYSVEWKRKNLKSTISKNISDYIILFDYDNKLKMSIMENYKLDNTRIILVRAGKEFKEIDNCTFEINVSNKEDYFKVFQSITKKNIVPSRIIHRYSIERYKLDEETHKNQINKGFYSLLYISQALMKLAVYKDVSLLYMYNNSNGDEPIYKSISGFAKTIHLENINYRYKVIGLNLEKSDDKNINIAKIVLDEFEDENNDVEVYYDGKTRYTKEYEEVELKEVSSNDGGFKLNGTYIITGGTGGIGMMFARYLSENFKANIVLSGRSKLDEKKKMAIEKLNKLGGKVRYIRADISKKSEVKNLIEESELNFGKINGILHCAGYIKDSLILNKKNEDIERVFASKIYGTILLTEMIKDKSLDFMVFFSGLASVMGNVGQADYSFANSFLDNFSGFASKMLSRTKVVSINWPIWKNGGMQIDDEIKNYMKNNMGMSEIEDNEGIDIVSCVIRCNLSQLIVYKQIKGKESLNIISNKGENEIIKVKSTNELEISDSLLHENMKKFIKGILSKELNLDPTEIISTEPWENYGIDSMSIIKMTNEIEKTFGSVSKTLFFEYQNVNDITAYFIDNYKDTIVEKLVGKVLVDEKKDIVQPKEKSKDSSSRFMNNNRFINKKVNDKKVVDDKVIETKVQEKEIIKEDNNKDDIAIIGISGHYPEAKNLNEYWENLKNSKDCITEIPSSRWDYKKYYNSKENKPYGRWGGFLSEYNQFDPLFFGIAPRDAELMDPQERLFLQTSWEAIEDAGYNIKELRKFDVGVYVGVMYGNYQIFGAEESLRGNTMALSSSYASIANRVSYIFNFNGPSIALDTMCSSSLTTVHLACQSIYSGECQVAVAGGVNLSIHPTKYIYLDSNSFMASDGRCRSFGEGGDGYVPGEGVGAVLLKSLSQAKADGDHIYAVIKASSINHGGRSNGYTVPNPNRQSELIEKTLKKADINPRCISYIEAHGTGTALGDPIEVTGLSKVFSKYTQDKQFCSIGSVKSNIGHLESAAGIAAITKVILQMKYKELVPSIHSDVLNSNINFENTPFYVQRECKEWKQPIVNIDGKDVKVPRIAGISAFGAGGSNAHMILEEYIDDKVEEENYSDEPNIIILSARNEDRLKEYAKRLLEYIDNNFEDKLELEKNMLSKVEEILSELISNLIQIDVDKLDSDDFNELNLDMVNIYNFADGINLKLNIKITTEDVINNHSIKSLAMYICNKYSSSIKKQIKKEPRKLELGNKLNLRDIAYTLQVGREEKDCRLAIVAPTVEYLRNKLQEYCNSSKNVDDIYSNKISKAREQAEQDEIIQKFIEEKKYNKIAELWINGAKIDWKLIYKNENPKRVSLPTYPFESKVYWYDSYKNTNKKVSNKEVNKEVSKEVVNRDITNNIVNNKKEDENYEFNSLLVGFEDSINSYRGNEVSLEIIDGSIALITMKDIRNRNMLSANLVTGLMSKFVEIERNKNIKAVVVTGYDNVFCMGGTQEQLLEISDAKRSFTDVPFVYKGLLEFPVPVIAAIQGHAFGGGLLFGLYADMVVMSEESAYSAVFLKYGFTPGMGATYILKEKFGDNLAKEMMYTARVFTGEELSKKGAPITFKPSKDVLKEALKIARSLSEKPLITLKTLKKELSNRILKELPLYIEREDLMHAETFTRPEVKERIQHFYLNNHDFNVNESSDDRDKLKNKKSRIKLNTLEDNSSEIKSNEVNYDNLDEILKALENKEISPERAIELANSKKN